MNLLDLFRKKPAHGGYPGHVPPRLLPRPCSELSTLKPRVVQRDGVAYIIFSRETQ